MAFHCCQTEALDVVLTELPEKVKLVEVLTAVSDAAEAKVNFKVFY